jgi:hypothetical protein
MTISRNRMRALVVALAATLALTFGFAAPAQATAQTCTLAKGGTVCTLVKGSGGRVDSVGVSRMSSGLASGNPGFICEYSAWFFAAPPRKPVVSLGTESRAGCGIGRVWLTKQVKRTFPKGTQVCAKFYEDRWSNYITQRCVGLR